MIPNTSHMDYLVTKLTLLDYQSGFCSLEMPQMHSAYFLTQQVNQFPYFSNLCSWLLEQCDVVPTWSEFDPPMGICNSIIAEMNQLTRSSKSMNLNPNKCYGGDILFILNQLADCALLKKRVRLNSPTYPSDHQSLAETAIEHEDVESDIDDIPSDDGISEEENAVENTMHHQQHNHSQAVLPMLMSSSDPLEWQEELERVKSKLKVRRKINQGGNWRAHFYQVQDHSKSVKETNENGVTKKLKRICNDINKQLQKIGNKEKFINNQYKKEAEDYRILLKEHKVALEKYESNHEIVSALQNDLQNITDKLETIKAEMDERNNSMTDTSPLLKIKNTIIMMEQEIQEMVVRCSIQQFRVLRAKVKDGKS